MSFLAEFDALFVGRRDVYARGYPDADKPNKYRYHLVNEALTPDVLKAHLCGTDLVGVYPILTDDTVGWFAIDFDAPKAADGQPHPDPFTIAWEAAKLQAQALERAGLLVYLERSRSGQGVHVWGFLDAPLAAATVRRALKPLLTDHEIFTSRDRFFPVQDRLLETKPLGNLIALPYFDGGRSGNSTFLDPDTQQPIPAREFLKQVHRNSAYILEQMAEAAGEDPVASRVSVVGTLEESDLRPERPIRGALKMLSAYGCPFMRHAWLNRRTLSEPMWYAALGQCTAFEHGRDLAHLISRDYPGYSEAETDRKYDQALRNPPVGYRWLEEHYPEIVGSYHNGKAPYHVGTVSLLDLVAQSRQDMCEIGSFNKDLERIGRLDSGELTAGILWGMPGFDEHLRLRNSELTVFGGKPSIGKTAFMVDALYRLGASGVPVFFFSAETAREPMRVRLLSRASGVDSRALRGERPSKLTKAEWKRLEEANAELQGLPIFEDYTSLDPTAVFDQVEQTLLSRRIPLDSPYVVFFDYLQFAAPFDREDNDYVRLSRLTTEFKFMAKILEHPIVIFSQLRRDKGLEDDDRPSHDWFKGTGRIEADMDTGLIMTGERIDGALAPRQIWCVKQREGRANFSIELMLQQEVSRFERTFSQPAQSVELTGQGGEDDLL